MAAVTSKANVVISRSAASSKSNRASACPLKSCVAKASAANTVRVATSARSSAFTGERLSASRSVQTASSRTNLEVVGLAQRAEYIWFDGAEGTPEKGMLFNEMRSKTKCIPEPIEVGGDFPEWSFDGSSTGQAEGNDSDCILKPCFSCPDPIRGGNNVLVLCEVMNPDGTPHRTNSRSKLEAIINEKVDAEKPLFGFEQEYTMLGSNGVYGWPSNGYPAPQGPFYCGVGPESVYGRPLAEAHMDACIRAGLTISGINAEVMPGQWEYQIGPAAPYEVGDHVMVSRWLLHRLGEDMGISITFEPKPVKGDWNGTGAHTNYSTESMRKPGGMEAINAAIECLSKKHAEHIAEYGTGNEERLTGKHETCDIYTFKSGVADRGSSIRIPRPVAMQGYGYLEDRRPAANVDPYVVARMLINTTIVEA
mmetsp:Transcript_36299/g.43861  ORF Transcript_36299/g.43861 Transcript_36299/m.43861 type:complete len:423 (-) Transcript_36299:182-1450(-)|eukprot:CAMPEP_0197857830 /NCGR_PEP_ID=MMETSP1438-20131217/31233_1 /TAXON_ID=1461541 /ORGANISM="Pterosperma sp., Strain CCMP1384" /LENGTH=422 /DNA_ID=CAMNT_0043473805 /DNA_START=69 /DNA_END=1337 /DNA_ORIENTATION=-